MIREDNEVQILLISQYYPPESALISSTLARSLIDMGHQVRVLTGFPNYPEGKLFEGYRQRWRYRELDGSVQVLRVPLWVDHSNSPLKRMLNYASFGVSAATAWDFARGADVIYVYATQMTPAFAPWVWRLVGGAPYVLHIQDLWPDSITGSSLIKSGLPSRVIGGAMQPWLRSVYRHAAAVIGIAPTMVRMLVERGVDPAKTYLQYNWALEATRPDVPRDVPSHKGVRLLYAGNIGDMQDLGTAVRAAHRSADAGVHLTLVGEGVARQELQGLVAELGSTNIEFKGRVPRDEMGPAYASSDYSLVTLKDLPNFRGTIPSKFQASLYQGLPIITTVQGDVRRIVEDLNVGFTADAESVDSLEEAFRRAAELGTDERESMAGRARGAYTELFSLNAGVCGIERTLVAAAKSNQQPKVNHQRVEQNKCPI